MILGPADYLGVGSRGVESTFLLCWLKNKDSHAGPITPLGYTSWFSYHLPSLPSPKLGLVIDSHFSFSPDVQPATKPCGSTGQACCSDPGSRLPETWSSVCLQGASGTLSRPQPGLPSPEATPAPKQSSCCTDWIVITA